MVPAPQRPSLQLVDKVPQNPHTIFVGINPAIRSAEVGHYYAHPSNSFWRIIAASGIEPRAVDATWDDVLVQQGFGFTDVVKRPTVGASEVAEHEFRSATRRLAALVSKRKPSIVAFVSKTAARAYYQDLRGSNVHYGLQERTIHTASVWFLPSTSGQSYADTTFAEKVEAFRKMGQQVKRVVKSGSNGKRVGRA